MLGFTGADGEYLGHTFTYGHAERSSTLVCNLCGEIYGKLHTRNQGRTNPRFSIRSGVCSSCDPVEGSILFNPWVEHLLSYCDGVPEGLLIYEFNLLLQIPDINDMKPLPIPSQYGEKIK